MKMFYLILEDYSAEEIQKAFRIWAAEQKNMPTPADIRQLAEQSRMYQTSKPTQWALPAPAKNSKSVSWSGKTWNQFDDDDVAGLHEHLATMTAQKRRDYLKYLSIWCGVPASQFHLE